MGKSITDEDYGGRQANGAKKGSINPEDLRSLSNFMKRLKENYRDQTSKVILPKIHSVINKNKGRIFFDYHKLKEKLKICKICDHWDKINTFIQCSRCEDNYHTGCINLEKWTTALCQSCQKGTKVLHKCSKCKKTPKSQQKRSCKSCESVYHKKCWRNKQQTCPNCIKFQKKSVQYKNYLPSEDTITSIRSPLFDFHHLIKNEKQLEYYTQELMTAIHQKGMLYTEELVNMQYFEDIFNDNSMDFGINFMSPDECRAYEEYKKMPIGPYLFRNVRGKGYDVVADKDIPAKSLICEYIGEVVTLRECVELQKHSENDSLMELQAGKNANETLIIRPERFTNIARFINGVKEDSNEGNVQSMKLLYKTKPLVLLVSTKPIKQGDSLSYDYNAGKIAAKYDTSYFK